MSPINAAFPYDPFKSHYSYEWLAMQQSNRGARRALLHSAVRHWLQAARESRGVIRSYGGNAPHEARILAQRKTNARAALAALKAA